MLGKFQQTMAGAPGFEPGIVSSEPTALPLGHAPRLGAFQKCGARGRNRTGTGFNSPRILSPVRLPVSPPGPNTIWSPVEDSNF